MKFTKMHGIGNDYVYVNCFIEKINNPAELAPIVSDRHKGIGGDGLILICPSSTPKADVRMRIFNADGSEAEMCGNGARCVAKYSYERGLAKSRGPFLIAGQEQCPISICIETGNGVLPVGLIIDGADKVQEVCVNMGQPILEPKNIPVSIPTKKIIEQPMQFENRAFMMTCVSMGNPHAVFFRENIASFDLQKFGPIIENHSIFPQRTNVHFVEVVNRNEFNMRTWERGSGITLACGTGASACCVAAVLTDRCDRTCTAHLPGGDLDLYWCKEDNCVYMTGTAVEVFEGIWAD
ncbi:MAG: diaminopimelate epimerase [Candidatus Brocadiia bacterium]|nr:MAG: diaminopimelate epimerase [Candidatus Brocadiia bacterium]